MSNLELAYWFYTRHIFDKEKNDLLKAYGLPIAGSVSSVLWELFGAILTGQTGTGGKGVDLKGWEVKSSKGRGAYEYQYHLHSGLEKLREDCIVNHLFFSYSETYEDVVVRVMSGLSLAEKYFTSWEPEYLLNYDAKVPASQRRQRFRKSIPFGHVEKHGKLIMKIVGGDLLEVNKGNLKSFNIRIL